MQEFDVILVPDNAVKFIRAQRDTAQKAKLAKDAWHIEQWNESCNETAGWLAENMPIEGDLLDIGCGLGGIDVLLSPLVDHMYLLDGTGWDDKRLGYQQETKPWNSLAVTGEVMKLNGLGDKITLIDYIDRPDIKVEIA
jgi:hypothetical protein